MKVIVEVKNRFKSVKDFLDNVHQRNLDSDFFKEVLKHPDIPQYIKEDIKLGKFATWDAFQKENDVNLTLIY